ncbi:MAG: chemotaxis protein CheA [bacterium]
MSIDVTQFHAVFFEESFEGLEVMESRLLELNLESPDDEEINEIFRAAHSIKGGSGSFGFSDVANFTHVLETLLDQVRDGTRTLTEPHRDLLLKSVDCLNEMLTEQRDEGTIHLEPVLAVQKELEALLGGESLESGSEQVSSSGEQSSSDESVWTISVKSDPVILQTGNDPARLFRELADLGALEVVADVGSIPHFGSLDPTLCYLNWEMKLKGVVKEEQILEIFEWVEDEVELDLKQEVKDDSQQQKATPENKQAKKPPVKAAKKAASKETSSIRVGIDKVDQLINMVGELVITQAMLSEIGETISGEHIDRLRDGLEQLERNTREMQESVMQIRMLPIGFSFNRFPRLVHDVSTKLGKQVDLVIKGEQTELDKTVLEKIGDPLVHLVRNSLDHGIETPEIRAQKGKPEIGVLELSAFHQGGNIIIQIKDDGAGLDCDKLKNKAIEKGLITEDQKLDDQSIKELIFAAGFSTADAVSDLSGRGVGMDVVRRNIEDLGGAVELKSELGVGTTFTIRLPLTLAILDGQLVRIGSHSYIIPLISIIESLPIEKEFVKSLSGKGELYQLRDDYLPIIRLHQVFNIAAEFTDLDQGILVIAETDGQPVAMYVDELLGQQQVVIKSLETNYTRIEGFSGATILGNGSVGLIVDIPGAVRKAHSDGKYHDRKPQRYVA